MGTPELPAGALRPAMPEAFALVAAGVPEHLDRQLAKLGVRAATAPSRAALLVALAWLVPLLLTLPAGTTTAFLADLRVWARFVLAIALLVLVERAVDRRLDIHLRQFFVAPLLAPGAIAPAMAAVSRALTRARYPAAALGCLALALAVAVFAVLVGERAGGSGWVFAGPPDDLALTAAGWWSILVSNTLFWFLVFRWLWCHVAWALLLRTLARLELRLVVSHPDGVGGLAFVGQYPNAFAAFVLAVSTAFAAGIVRAFAEDALDLQTYGYLMAGWLALVLLLFASPLMAFRAPLQRLKEATMLEASAQATRFQRAVERGVFGRNLAAGGDADTTTKADIPDPAGLYAAAKKLATLPLDRTAIVPLTAASLLPLVAAGTTRLPLADLWKIAKRLVLL